MTDDQTSASETIDIPGVEPARVFAHLTDPANHAANGAHVVGPVGTDRITGKGDRFGMRMRWVVPYRIVNTVVEYDQDRRLAWRHFAGHRWRYELAPTADGEGTTVTETFDLSPLPRPAHVVYRTAFGFPDAYHRNLRESLRRLRDELAPA